MTEMFGEAWPPMSVPDLAPDDDDAGLLCVYFQSILLKFEDNLKALVDFYKQ